MTARRVLIAEDEPKTAAILADYLTTHGFVPEITADGARAVASVLADEPAALILDLNLPGLDGVEVCRRLRRTSAMPIFMLTARVDEIDRLIGLEVGADDYICKPFSPREVMARLHAVLRRALGAVITGGPAWRAYPDRLTIEGPDVSLALTVVEFRIFAALIGQPGRIFSRDQLLDRAHPDFRDVSDRVIDSHIKNLRRKLADAGADPAVIGSVYGAGYRFLPEG